MNPEFKRFLALYEISIQRIGKYMDYVNDDNFKSIPVKSSKNFLAGRVGEINIDTLVRHIIVAEINWMECINTIQDGDTIPLPKSIIIDVDFALQQVADYYKSEIQASYEGLKRIDEEVLSFEVQFAGKRYTVMGLLWFMFSHNAFHLGQIDLLMRQQELYSPEFMLAFNVPGVAA